MIIARGTSSTKQYKLVTPGTHLAKCYRIIDLGTQSFVWKGDEGSNRKVLIQFEVHSEDEQGNPLVTDNGDPLSIGKNYTLSLDDRSSLRRDLTILRGVEFTPEELKGFKLDVMLNWWAMLSVVHTPSEGRTYANIKSVSTVSPAIKKMGLPAPHNKPVIFSIDKPDMDLFNSFSDGLKAKIEKSPEWQALMSYAPVPVRRTNPAPQQTSRPAAPAAEFEEDDIPF
jgi:hypothetical protein